MVVMVVHSTDNWYHRSIILIRRQPLVHKAEVKVVGTQKWCRDLKCIKRPLRNKNWAQTLQRNNPGRKWNIYFNMKLKTSIVWGSLAGIPCCVPHGLTTSLVFHSDDSSSVDEHSLKTDLKGPVGFLFYTFFTGARLSKTWLKLW